MVAVPKISAVSSNAFSRCATGSGATLRCALRARDTYSGGTKLNSPTGTPAVLVRISRLRVRYSPPGPSASMSTKSVVTLGVSPGTSVHAFNDSLALEGGHRPHGTDGIAELPCGPEHPDGHIAFQVIRQEHAFADVVHHHLADLPVGHLFTGVRVDYPEHHIRCPRVENECVAVGSGNRLRENHGAAEGHRDRRVREDVA